MLLLWLKRMTTMSRSWENAFILYFPKMKQSPACGTEKRAGIRSKQLAPNKVSNGVRC